MAGPWEKYQAARAGQPAGMLQAGNIDLDHRPVVVGGWAGRTGYDIATYELAGDQWRRTSPGGPALASTKSELLSATAVASRPHSLLLVGSAEELAPGAVYRFSAFRPPDAEPDDPDPGPRLHVVATLNSRAPNEAPSMRGGFPVVFGQTTVDVHREEGRRVSVDTASYENFAGPGRVSVMASVAISGAAVSPLMGRYAVQMAPYRFLLALFNARVGSWVRNPMHTTTQSQVPPQGPRFLWMTAKPGLWQVALEGVGRTSADFRWIYVSDGGHLDNTGLVECVRHCVARGTGGRILVLDASNDPVDTWSAVGDAISVVRADLNIDLRRVAYADQHFGEKGRVSAPGWRTDRGRIYVKYGEPEEQLDRVQAGRAVPYQVWRYRRGRDRYYVFADRSNGIGIFQLVH